jgi:hypothetical protein
VIYVIFIIYLITGSTGTTESIVIASRLRRSNPDRRALHAMPFNLPVAEESYISMILIQHLIFYL